MGTVSLSHGSPHTAHGRWSWSAALFCLVLVATAGAQTSVLTYHNDISRTGQNITEAILTPVNVSSDRFGKLFAQHVDGDVYAQPLYVPKLAIPGKGTHNVVIVATEANSLYAFDADSVSGPDAGVLWHVSLLDAAHGAPTGAAAVDARSDLRCGTIAPQVGITATPVIDPTRGTLYVEAFSKEHDALIHRLHALDIATGVERKGSPVMVTAPTEGKEKIDIPFNPVREIDRAGVLLSHDRVYVTYGSGCDRPVYQGWVFAYDATTLAARGAFVTAREHGKAAIWMSGAAPAADAQGNVFLATGDGWFDTASSVPRELGDSILKIAPQASGLTLADYFTPFNQVLLARHDGDLGSGGVLLLPDQPGGHPHVLVEAGKNGTLYVLDRDTLTAGNLHYCVNCASDTQIVQELPGAATGGVWGGPVYWNNTLYISGSDDVLRAFTLRDGHLQSAPVSASKDLCDYPGCGLSLSANGDHDGILWALQVGGSEPSILKAYDARDLKRSLYSSDQHHGRDAPGGALKFIVPTIADGKVYVGGTRQLTVFGLSARP